MLSLGLLLRRMRHVQENKIHWVEAVTHEFVVDVTHRRKQAMRLAS